MTTGVEVVNAALIKLGEKPITSFDDNTPAANIAKVRYDSLVASALIKHR